MFNKILMVCIGNICRSPMAEAILKHQANEHGISLQVNSAGLRAMVGHPAETTIQALLKEDGIDCSEHRAQQLTAELVSDAELILVMEKSHRNEIMRLFPSATGKVHLLGKWGDFEVVDPYKRHQQIFQETYHVIKQGINDWTTKLNLWD